MFARSAGASLETTLDMFAATVTGQVIRPDEPAFEAARRGHNLAIDARPVAILRAADAADVARAVELARTTGLELAIRSGGHSVAGHSTGDGVLVVDMTAMTGLHIDPATRLVYAQPGLTAGAVTTALAAHGLAIPFGDTPTVGITGLTLGGGIGYLARSHGLAIDHLQAVELVTATGRQIVASADEHPDLFWALRGGGGNFGIVTRLIYRAVEVDTVYGGALMLPATAETLAGVVAAAAAAPDALTTITDMFVAPPMPFLPEAWVGRPILSVTAVYAGDPADGEAALAPFRALAEPLADFLGPMPYPGIYEFTEEAGVPSAYHLRSSFLASFDLEAAGTVMRAFETAPESMSLFHIRVLGGAMAQVPADATAFAHRDAPILAMMLSSFEDGDGAVQGAWVSGLHDGLRPLAQGVYSNFLGDEGQGRVHEAYPAETYARLAAVKRAYDPTNVFRRNQNIRPATS
jgi:FAD/FMN-containing dehydrogenase